VRRGGAPDPLPEWARTGFTPPDQKAPYVLGTGGDIPGVVFGDPLTAVQRPDKNNKILWVSRLDVKGDLLRIKARLAGAGLTVGPGSADAATTRRPSHPPSTYRQGAGPGEDVHVVRS
jgi:hypothetical protein